jgi:adenylate kinase
MRLVLMGPPGVGKGTQAVMLRDSMGVAHISTGDILREAVQKGTALGRKVRSFVELGQLVPDDLMADLIAERLGREDAKEGFILDGYPRTLQQVAVLDRVLSKVDVTLDRVILLVAAEAEIVRRGTGRRLCPRCSRVYHIDARPPASAGVCDACGAALVQRPDDTESVILERIRVYEEKTMPAAEAYRERGVLREVNCSGSPEEVFSKLRAAVAES